MKKENGFTLIELIITVAILGILAAVGSSAFDKQKKKGYRTDAIRSLTTMAQNQEQWHSSNGLYTNDITDIGGAVSFEQKYGLNLTNITSDTYTITATATGTQAADTDCNKFIIKHTGQKTALKSDSTANTKCWPK